MHSCFKYLIVHQMCIIPLLKIVPNKYTIYSYIVIFVETHSAPLIQETAEHFLKIKQNIYFLFLYM